MLCFYIISMHVLFPHSKVVLEFALISYTEGPMLLLVSCCWPSRARFHIGTLGGKTLNFKSEWQDMAVAATSD